MFSYSAANARITSRAFSLWLVVILIYESGVIGSYAK